MRATPSAMSVVRALCLWSVLCVCACGSPGLRRIPESRSRYDTLAPPERVRFDSARRDMDAGRIAAARSELEALFGEHPDSLIVGVWLQECELSIATASVVDPLRAKASGDAATGEIVPEVEALRQRYRRAAEASPSVVRLVLAARLEPDVPAAMLLLDRAEELDADCAWVHYGRAYLAARVDDWAQARVWIARAREADAGHLPTRWLEAWMLAQGGNVADAIGALEAWLARAQGDSRVDVRLVRAAELDLAVLSVLDGDPKRAQKILATLGDGAPDAGRRLAAVAAAEQALGNYVDALAAARYSEAVGPGEILPVVQQALLYDTWLHDPVAAEAAWTRVLAISRASPDLGKLLELMRARVRLERFEVHRERARRTDGGAPRGEGRV